MKSISNYLLVGHSRDVMTGVWSGAPKLSPEQVREKLKGNSGLWLHAPRCGYPDVEELVFIIEALRLGKDLILTRRPNWVHDESMPTWRALRTNYATNKTVPLEVANEDLEGLVAVVLGGAR